MQSMLLNLRSVAGLLLFGSLSLCVFAQSIQTNQAENAQGPERVHSEAVLRPIISVTTTYPGASAQVVADTVAAPIEQQVDGVEGSLCLVSRCANDGGYTLHVVFKIGVDPRIAQGLIQNRVNLAKPILPDAVKKLGVTVKKKASVLALVTLSSPGRRFDDIYLSRYADIQIKDELTRLPGVADVCPLGKCDPGMRIWLVPEKMRARKLTPADVIQALEQQNTQVKASKLSGRPGKETAFEFTLDNLGRLAQATDVEEIVVKVDSAGRVVRLKDVARVEYMAGKQSQQSLNGKLVAVLGVYATDAAGSRQISATVRKRLSQLRKNLPDDITLRSAFDFTPHPDGSGGPETPEYLLLEPVLPLDITAERARAFMHRCEAVLRDSDGAQDVLALSENPFGLRGSQRCIVVRLAPAAKRRARRDQIAETIRTRNLPEGTLRVRDLSGPSHFPSYAYPIDLAIHGPESEGVRKLAEKLAGRLRRSRKLTDVDVSAGSAQVKMIHFDVNAAAARDRGVTVAEVFETLQLYLGMWSVKNFQRSGHTLTVQGEARPILSRIEDLKKLKVRNGDGKMVPLTDLAAIREATGTALIERYNLQPMTGITANPGAGVSLAEARSLCQALAEDARKELRLPKDYRLSWLESLPVPK